MKVADLRNVLGEIEDIYAAAGAKGPADDLAELINLFDGPEDAEVSAVLEELRSLYDAPKPDADATEPSDLNAAVVERHLARLASLPDDGSQDADTVNRLRDDKAVGKAEANAIQAAFIGGRAAWPSRKAAIDAIERTVAGRRRNAAIMDHIKTVTPW